MMDQRLDPNRHVIRSRDFVNDAVAHIVEAAVAAQRKGHLFRLSLCGGSTPRPVYEALSTNREIDWQRTLITFGDERCVPPNHADSNYRMAAEALLQPAGVPDQHVLRMEGEWPPSEAAQRYEAALRTHLDERDEHSLFSHDLVLLGMGDDGHTASLFPDTHALRCKDRWVTENFLPKVNAYRLTMTFPLINASRRVCFLVTGETKAPIYEAIFRGETDWPSALVRPEHGDLHWIVA